MQKVACRALAGGGMLVFLAATAATVRADDFSWASPDSGSFFDPANWSPTGVPDAGSLIEFNQSAADPYTVSFGQFAIVNQIRIKNDNVIFDALDPVLRVMPRQFPGPARSGEITVGELGGEVGTWTIRNGMLEFTATAVTIGKEAGSTGTIHLDGSQGATSWSLVNSAPPVIGKGGKGTLELSAGATVRVGSRIYVGEQATAEGEVIVRGAGSTLVGNDPDFGLRMDVGIAGDGKLSLLDGGTLTAEIMALAREAGSSAELLVDGVGSELQVDLIAIGARGTATATISSGASVRPLPVSYPPSSVLGGLLGSHGSLVVTDPGTSVQISALDLGVAGGEGFLQVKDGASFSTNTIATDRPETGHARIEIDGSGTTADLGVFRLGYYGTGTMEVTGGAEVTTRSLMQMAFTEGASARVRVDGPGSQWTHGRGLVAEDIVFALAGDCLLEITNGGTVIVPATPSRYMSGSYLTGDGAVVIVDGADSKWMNGVPVYVAGGPDGDPYHPPVNARIEIRNGGVVESGRYAHDLRPGFFGIGTTVWEGGVVTIDDGTLRGPLVSNMGRVENGGLIVGDFDNLEDGVLTGDGTIEGRLKLAAGSTLAPGNSPGRLSATSVLWNGDSSFELEINSAAGQAGGPVGWDLLAIDEALDLAADTSDPIVLALKSLATDDSQGPVFDFNPGQNYLWTFATVTSGGAGGISGFDPGAFAIDTSAFANELDGGTFSVLQSGNSLVLQFASAVPEANGLMLVGFGIAGVIGCLRRRNRASG